MREYVVHTTAPYRLLEAYLAKRGVALKPGKNGQLIGDCPCAYRHDKSKGKRQLSVFTGDKGIPLVDCWSSNCPLHGAHDIVSACQVIDRIKDPKEARARLETMFGISFASCCGGTAEKSPQSLAERLRSVGKASRERKQQEENWRLLQEFLKRDSTHWRAEQVERSPIEVPADPCDHFYPFRDNMYVPTWDIWSGDMYDTGSPEHAEFFGPAGKMENSRNMLGRVFVSKSTFLPGTISRCEKQVERTIWAVMECDGLCKDRELNKFASLQFYLHISKELGVEIRALVDTTSKSLHCWIPFDAAKVAEIERLYGKMIVPGATEPAILLDTGVLTNVSGAVRCPGRVNLKTGWHHVFLFLAGLSGSVRALNENRP